MTRIEHETTIERPPEEVFRFLADGSNNPRWQPPVLATSQLGPHLGVGTTFAQTVRHPFGFTVSCDYRITVFEPGRELALQTISGGPVRPIQRYLLTATPDGATTVRDVIEYRPRGLVRFALPTLALLRPLFAWEASWVDNARAVLTGSRVRRGSRPGETAAPSA